MGDLQACSMEDYRSMLEKGVCPEPKFSHTATVVGKRIYIFGGDQGDSLSNDVQIVDTLTGKWIIPMVLGTRPSPRRGHLAVFLNNDRILILGGGSVPNDNIWFLEVDTAFVKWQKEIQVEAVADAGKRCILDIDVQGARSVRNSTLDALFIFICPPSFEELEKRLRGRGTEKEEQVQKRLRTARAELELGKNSTLFDHILVNDDLETCYLRLKEILGLNKASFPSAATNGLPEPSLKDVELLAGHSASLMDQKVTVYGGTTADGRASNNVLVLDVSCLGGGAPGRTQGLKLYRKEAPDPYNCINQGPSSAEQLKKLHPEVMLAGNMGV